jgi:folate-dependent phosphoribosylglycinamide formyltransferase PurN
MMRRRIFDSSRLDSSILEIDDGRIVRQRRIEILPTADISKGRKRILKM